MLLVQPFDLKVSNTVQNPMRQPFTILLTMGFLALYGAYCLWMGYTSSYWAYGVTGIIAFIGSVGLYLNKPWSRFVVYFFAAGIAIVWFYGAWVFFPYGNFSQRPILETAISFLPGFLILTMCVGCSYSVSKHFGTGNSQTSPPHASSGDPNECERLKTEKAP